MSFAILQRGIKVVILFFIYFSHNYFLHIKYKQPLDVF